MDVKQSYSHCSLGHNLHPRVTVFVHVLTYIFFPSNKKFLCFEYQV